MKLKREVARYEPPSEPNWLDVAEVVAIVFLVTVAAYVLAYLPK